MKKVISIILCAVMLVSCVCFTACGKDDKNDTLVMATNAAFPPYEFKEGSGYAGIDVEIAEAIAKELGMKLEIVDIDFGAIVAGVQSGKYDFGMAGMTVTDERKQSVNFTESYAKGIQSVIVPENSKITSFKDFYTGFDEKENPTGVKEGIKIGVQQDTTGDIFSTYEPEKGGFGKDNVVRYKTGAEAVQALLAGKITAVIIDDEPAKSYVAANEGLKILEGKYVEEDYAICVSKDNDELLKKINDALVKLKNDGTVDEIIAKYIK